MNIRRNSGETLEMEPGCYIDGHHGQYAYDNLADMASALLGVEDYTRLAYEARQADDMEALVEISDEALEALNDATTGGYWAWEDGEIFLVGSDD